MRYAKRIFLYGIPKSLLLKIIIFLVILLIGKNVFALEYDVTSSITSPQGQGRIGTYTGLEIYNSGSNNVYNVNTRYNGQLSQIVYNIPLPDNWEDGSCFSTNVNYTVTMYMATDDWRNNFSTVIVKNSLSPSSNWSNGNVTFVSMKKIYFTFKIPTSESGSCYDSFLVTLKSNNISTQAFTGVSNWNLSKVTITDPTTSSSSGSSGGGSSGSTNQDIINNNTNNTNNIITNNNNNTSNIIDNANQNTQNIIKALDDNFKSCSTGSNLFQSGSITSSKYLNSSGNLLSNNDWFITNYIPVTAGDSYVIDGTTITGGDPISLVFYDSNKNYVSGAQHYDYIPPKTITIPNGVSYVRDSVYNADINTYSFKKLNCSNKLDELREQQNQNTQDIINNQNSNTQQQIESQKVCNTIDKANIKSDNKYLNAYGTEMDSNNYGITDYIKITNSTIKVIQNYISQYSCFYDMNKNKINCIANNQNVGINIDIPNNAYYFRATINKANNKPIYEICRNGNQALTDSLTDSNVDNGTGSDFFDSFTTSDNGGISAIITKPLTIVNNLLSNNNQCANLSLPEFMGVNNAYLPSGCILWNNAPSLVSTLWNIFVCGFASYYILKDLFKIIENLKNPDNDRVEVMDL